MTAFDNREFGRYKQEAQAQWGHTEAYREYVQRTNDAPSRSATEGLEDIFAEFASLYG